MPQARSPRLANALLIVWFVIIGADRIDLFGGEGPILFTPYLALTPLVVGSELLRRRLAGRRIVLGRNGTLLMALIFALLGIIGASVLVSPETILSAGRAGLVAAEVLGALAVIVAASDRDDLLVVFARGAVAGLWLFTALNVLQVGAMLGLVTPLAHLGRATIDLMPSTYGGIVPRLSGVVSDQNRGGLLLLFYGWFLSYRSRGQSTAYLLLIVALMIFTLSRSAALAAAATVAFVVLERRTATPSTAALLSLLGLTSAIVLALLLSPELRASSTLLLDPLSNRLSVGEGSSQSHLLLIQRGVETGSASPSRLLLGLGYGSGFTVLQDIFPGNRYGNFHSLYVTMFAECGLVALLLILVVVGVPLVRRGPFRPMVAGMAAFNVFYQSTAEPSFWIILVLAWLAMDGPETLVRGYYGRVRRKVTAVRAPSRSTIPSKYDEPFPNVTE